MLLTRLTLEQQNILVGGLLGDFSLQTGSKGRTWRLRVLHSLRQEPLLRHTYEKFKDMCTSPPAYGKIYDPRTDKSYERYYFNTTIQPVLAEYGKLFYKKASTLDENSARSEKSNTARTKWVKVLPENIDELITPLGLAYFYMHDGALKWAGRSNAVRLCTDHFTVSEVRRLCETFKRKFDLDCSIQLKDAKPRIYIKERSYSNLRELILPHLHDSMLYKFPDGNYQPMASFDRRSKERKKN